MQLPDLMPNGIPSNQDLHYLSSLEVLDESGEKVKFGSLFGERRTLVVFVRSWLCGKCTLYISQLGEVITPSKLEAAGLNVVVVGCGGHELVKGFKENTSCTFPIYSDPTRATFLKLGCSQNGGEFVFGPGEICSFAHRMQNSEDHTDLPELFAAVGIRT
ncbi:hypothetical protein BDY24DRAFT_411201 [Mrakia frigida]|uniref:uncharacterized protein n=1 Tax=Mrakia frigida TaxID=29902 RepID=UPI003FCC08D0